MLSHIFIIICILFVSLSAMASEAAAKVIKVAGSVTAEDAGCAKRSLARGADVFKSDTVTTAADAFATLRFTDGTILDLAAASSLNLREYSFAPAKPEEDKFQSELIQGGFRAITGTIGKRSPSEFSSKTRLTTLTVRGSGFASGVAGEGSACGLPLPENSNNDPVFFSVIQGGIDIEADNKTYPLDANSNTQSFEMADGNIKVSREVLDFKKLGIRFVTTMAQFQNEALNFPIPEEQTTRPTGGAGGGGDSPCGTLNAVEGALPPSANP